MEHVTAEFLPLQVVEGNGFIDELHSAPAHLDDDFLFLIHQLNVEGALESDNIVLINACVFQHTDLQ
eukprot:scaffold183249_cov30-Attheya_sp.AAC.2